MNLWGRLGISVAIVAVFSIVMLEVFQGLAFYQQYRWAICAGFGGMGVFLLLVGGFVNARIRESRRDDPDAPPGPFLLVNLQYWGLMLTIFAILVIFIIPYRKVQARETKPAPPKETGKKVLPTPATNAPPPKPIPTILFPPLKLQGIAFKETNSSALINGRTYFVGNYIGDAKLISIDEMSIVVELSGHQQGLRLED
jgi:hypothetical protein